MWATNTGEEMAQASVCVAKAKAEIKSNTHIYIMRTE